MNIAAGETIRARECLDPEEVAALVDGRLAAAAREDALGHLAGCEACYELFTETSRAVVAEEGSAAPLRPWTSRWLMPGLAAAGLVLAAVVALLLVRRPSPLTVAELAAAVPVTAASHVRPLPAMRGGAATLGSAAAVGALLVDLRVAAAAGDEARGRAVLERLAAELASVAHMSEEAGWAREAAAGPMDAAAWGRLAETVEHRADERFPRPWPEMGKVLAAGRLAAATQTAGFFTSPRRRLLEGARAGGVDPEMESALEAVLAEWSRAPRDFPALERTLLHALHVAVRPR